MSALALTSSDLDKLPAALDLGTACRAMNISRSKGYDMLRAGTFPLPALRIGGQWRFRASDLRALLEGGPAQEGASPAPRTGPAADTARPPRAAGTSREASTPLLRVNRPPNRV